MKLISHRLTPELAFTEIRSLIGVGTVASPSPVSALPSATILEAVPQYISGRTSYFQV